MKTKWNKGFFNLKNSSVNTALLESMESLKKIAEKQSDTIKTVAEHYQKMAKLDHLMKKRKDQNG